MHCVLKLDIKCFKIVLKYSKYCCIYIFFLSSWWLSGILKSSITRAWCGGSRQIILLRRGWLPWDLGSVRGKWSVRYDIMCLSSWKKAVPWVQKQSTRPLARLGYSLLHLLPERPWDLTWTRKLKSESIQEIWFRVEDISVNLWSLYCLFSRNRVPACLLPLAHSCTDTFPLFQCPGRGLGREAQTVSLSTVHLDPQPKPLLPPCRPDWYIWLKTA